MPARRNFLPERAASKNDAIDPHIPGNVIVYRFGDINKAVDWPSRKRQASGGNSARPSDR